MDFKFLDSELDWILSSRERRFSIDLTLDLKDDPFSFGFGKFKDEISEVYVEISTSTTIEHVCRKPLVKNEPATPSASDKSAKRARESKPHICTSDLKSRPRYEAPKAVNRRRYPEKLEIKKPPPEIVMKKTALTPIVLPCIDAPVKVIKPLRFIEHMMEICEPSIKSVAPTAPVSPVKPSEPKENIVKTEVTAKLEVEETEAPCDPSEKRIGVYTVEARKARLAKFHEKRKKRVWRKTIKYDCRKKLADNRPRVKGRFVKRDEEEDSGSASEDDDQTLDESIIANELSSEEVFNSIMNMD